MTTVLWVAAALGATVLLALLRRRAVRARWRILRGSTGRPSLFEIVESLTRRASAAPSAAPSAAVVAATAVLGLFTGLVAGGPVAGMALAAYAGSGAHLLARRARRHAQTAARTEAVDAVVGLAADLRAGVPAGRALLAAEPVLARAAGSGAEAAAIASRVRCAVRVAESTGAPLADVLDRLDEHLRAADRARAVASAQAAGAHASAALLAVLPLAGVGLGTLIGVDPVRVLLHTPVGAVATLLAGALHIGGLAWAGRLARVEVSV